MHKPIHCTLCIPNITKCEINMASFLMLKHTYTRRPLTNCTFANLNRDSLLTNVYGGQFLDLFFALTMDTCFHSVLLINEIGYTS